MGCGKGITPSMVCGDEPAGPGAGHALCLACAKPPAPAATIVDLSSRVTERLAVMARVRPLFVSAFREAVEPAEIRRLIDLAVSVTTAILKGE